MQHLGNIWETIHELLKVNNNFDKIFSEGNPELEKLMDDENIITEFKNCNQKLMDYMKIEQYEKLVKFIIEMPQNEEDKKRAFKFPFVACELLTSDITQIYDTFLNYQEEAKEEEDDENDYPQNRNTMKNNQLIDFDGDDSIYWSKSCENCGSEFQTREQYLKHMRTSTCRDELATRGPSRQTISGKASQKESYSHEEEGKIEHRVSTLENQFKMIMNLQQNFDDFENSKAQLKQKTDQVIQLQLNLQELEEKLQDKFDVIFKQKQSMNGMKKVIADQQDEIRQLKLQSNGGENYQSTLQYMKKDGTYLLVLLLSFLRNEEPVNLTLAGYFSKVLNALITKQETEVVNFLYSDISILNSFVKNLHSRSITETLYKIISFETTEIKDSYFDQRIQIIVDIVDLINDPQTDSEVRANCTFIIGETIRRWQFSNRGGDILKYILNDLHEKILNGIVSEDNSVVYHSAVIMNIIFQTLINQQQKVQSYEESKHSEEFREQALEEEQLIASYIKIIPELLEQLTFQPVDSFQTSYRANLRPLGTTKLKIIELIQISLSHNNFKVIQELALNSFFEKLLNLFEEYEWNNVLHNRIEKIIINALESTGNTLQRSLFVDAKFIEFLKNVSMDVNSKSTVPPSEKKKPFRKGYLGHICKLGNILLKMKQNNHEEVTQFIEKSEEDWNTFVSGFLKAQNDKDNRELGGHTLQGDSEKEEEEGSSAHFNKSEVEEKYKPFLSSNNTSHDEIDIEEEEEADKQQPDLEEKFDDIDDDEEEDNKQQNNNNNQVEEEDEDDDDDEKNNIVAKDKLQQENQKQVIENVDVLNDAFDKEEETNENQNKEQDWENTWEKSGSQEEENKNSSSNSQDEQKQVVQQFDDFENFDVDEKQDDSKKEEEVAVEQQDQQEPENEEKNEKN